MDCEICGNEEEKDVICMKCYKKKVKDYNLNIGITKLAVAKIHELRVEIEKLRETIKQGNKKGD